MEESLRGHRTGGSNRSHFLKENILRVLGEALDIAKKGNLGPRGAKEDRGPAHPKKFAVSFSN